jgi:hypothetical protein
MAMNAMPFFLWLKVPPAEDSSKTAVIISTLYKRVLKMCLLFGFLDIK